MNTPDTEGEKVTRNAGDFHTEAPVVHVSDVRSLLTSIITRYKEELLELDGKEV